MSIAKVLYLVSAILFGLGLLVEFPSIALGLLFLAAGHFAE